MPRFRLEEERKMNLCLQVQPTLLLLFPPSHYTLILKHLQWFHGSSGEEEEEKKKRRKPKEVSNG